MKSALYSLYSETGEILMVTRNTAPAIAGAVRDGSYAGAIAGAYDGSEVYVVEGRPHARPEMAITQKGAVLSGVPDGASVSINNRDYRADGTDIELQFSQPGTKLIEVSLWPYKTYRVTHEN